MTAWPPTGLSSALRARNEITIRQLLTHQGGLIADNALDDYRQGSQVALERIFALPCTVKPGTKFIYSDVGFIVLGEIIRRITGQDVHEFSQQHLFQPLGMTQTGYLPATALQQRAAPTEQRDGHWMQGEVHDPRAYALGGIAGHAGLFSCADDLAIYAQMMLQRGAYGNANVLRPATVHAMTRAYSVDGNLRGLGWDKLSSLSSNRGNQLTAEAFGHGGFTGTVLWIDPGLDLFFVFLSNRVHPDGQGSVNALAGRIASAAAAAITDGTSSSAAEWPASAATPVARRANGDEELRGGLGRSDSNTTAEPSVVLTGLDRLQQDGWQLLAGQRVGLITNQTGVDRAGRSNVQLFREASQIKLVALFSPEHGLTGQRDQPSIDDSIDPATGLRVFSLYGATRQPTAEQLALIDTLVFDIQDIGTRFYTYVSTMGLAMQTAAQHQKRFVVLDRPNPINGVDVEGPVLDDGLQSFVGFHTLPVRHGMTIGELAQMFKAELNLNVDLTVVHMEGWRRQQYFDDTGLLWVDPSPNMRNLNQALLYPGIGLLETTNLSVGRGTDTPFERLGAPWIDGLQLARSLSAAGLRGVKFTPVDFRPNASVHANTLCHGVQILITDRRAIRPLDVGLQIASLLRQMYPSEWDVASYQRLLADQAVWSAVQRAQPLGEIHSIFEGELQQFRQRRSAFLLYAE